MGNKPCVELDAIEPNRLKDLVEDAIISHVDQRSWQIQKQVEAGERLGLLAMRDAFGEKAS